MGKTITYLKSGIAQYGVTILLIMIFLAGIYFIFWMGNSNEVTKMEKELQVFISFSGWEIVTK